MPIRTTCPSCQTVYSLADSLAGKKVRCKKCNEVIVVRAVKERAEGSASAVEAGSREKIQSRPQQPKRPVVRDEEELARPRRRNREEEAYSRRPRRRSNRGLVIGLIVGGAALVLLLGGGGILAIFLLIGRLSNDETPDLTSPAPFVEEDGPWPGARPAVAPPNAVTLHILGVANESTQEAVTEKLEALLSAGGHVSLTTARRGDRMTVLVMPVKDVQAFSQQLDFGTVREVNGRTITMLAHKVEGPPPNADAVTRALHHLKSTNQLKRAEAVRKLKETLPDERRAEVVKALEPLLNDANFFTRQDVIEALGVWGNKDAVPLLLNAMREKETRDTAMKALGRLKDERAVEPIVERLDDFFDNHEAAEALKQMGPMAEQAVLARLNHHEFMMRMTVFDILKVIGTKKSLPSLEKASADQNIVIATTAKETIQAITARP